MKSEFYQVIATLYDAAGRYCGQLVAFNCTTRKEAERFADNYRTSGNGMIGRCMASIGATVVTYSVQEPDESEFYDAVCRDLVKLLKEPENQGEDVPYPIREEVIKYRLAGESTRKAAQDWIDWYLAN